MDLRGQPISGSSFYLMLNSAAEAVLFKLPSDRWGQSWRLVFDTTNPEPPDLVADPPAAALLPSTENGTPADVDAVDPDKLYAFNADVPVTARSVVLLERVS